MSTIGEEHWENNGWSFDWCVASADKWWFVTSEIWYNTTPKQLNLSVFDLFSRVLICNQMITTGRVNLRRKRFRLSDKLLIVPQKRINRWNSDLPLLHVFFQNLPWGVSIHIIILPPEFWHVWKTRRRVARERRRACYSCVFYKKNVRST